MSLVDVILSRRSVRRYTSDPIPEDVLHKILEAGRLAPSAGNRQPWHFIVVTDPEIKHKLSRMEVSYYGKGWNWCIKDSAVTIVGCGYVDTPWVRKWSTIDVTIALQNMVIAAQAQGVGSCWIGDFKQREVKRILGIPKNLRVIALIALGYPAEHPGPKVKKNLEEIVHHNRF